VVVVVKKKKRRRRMLMSMTTFVWQGEMVAQGNDACSIATYVGGLRCCEGGMVLLDKDQQQPPVSVWVMTVR
jgi:hypothetical protein